ncbi:MAG: hypothetical protein M9958_06780 [Chitinophagales bacterium]|nr:hypothetical protein [Chitinophagales bacterium]
MAQLRYISVLLVISLLFSSYAEAPSTEPYFVKMKGFKVVTFNAKRIELSSIAVFFNTYNHKAKLKEVNIDVYLENKYLGKVNNLEDVSIPKSSAFDIPLILNLDPPGPAITNSLWQGTKLLTGQKVKIRYEGYIKLKVLAFVPITVKIKDEMSYSIF